MAPSDRRDETRPGASDEADDLPDVAGEPEPGWVEDIRRRRRERAERLRELLEPDDTDPERSRG